MTLKFSSLRVFMYDLDHLDVEWEFENTAEDPERWDFYVLRCVDGAGGPFTTISGPMRHDETRFRDAEVNQLHNWRTYFYQLKAVNKDDDREVIAGPAYLEAPPNLINVELRRRFELMLREFNGRLVFVFPAITSGFRCPTCYDQGNNDRGRSIGRSLQQNCPTCFDTTFVGGFGRALLSRMQIDPSAKDVQRTDTTETSVQATSARLSFFPPLKPKDMIVEAENVRWEVQPVTGTQLLRASVHQEVTLHRIPRSDIRYEVPTDLSLIREAGPKREFTRPMNLESAQPSETPIVDNLLDGLLGDLAGD